MTKLFGTALGLPMTIFLRILSILYAFGAAVHIGNILGFGELPFGDAPLSWQLGDIFYGILDATAAIGLFLLKPWGVAAFLVAAGSEILLFTVAPEWFVVEPHHNMLLRSFVVYHLVSISIYLGLRWRQRPA